MLFADNELFKNTEVGALANADEIDMALEVETGNGWDYIDTDSAHIDEDIVETFEALEVDFVEELALEIEENSGHAISHEEALKMAREQYESTGYPYCGPDTGDRA